MIERRRQVCRWHASTDRISLMQAAAKAIAFHALDAISARGAFHIVLAGGDTPRPVYEALRDADLEWPHWHVYFGDERCAPPSDPGRNSTMALAALFARVPVRNEFFHAIAAEHGPLAAAAAYNDVLAPVGEFDLVLLGLGEDGHTASLFPDNPAGDHADSPAALPVFNAPKPPPERVSLSAERLSRTRAAIFLVTGESKSAAVARWRAGADIPAAHIVPAAGVDIMLDAALLAG